MASNVEIKAMVLDAAALERRVQTLANGAAVDIAQDDTFFACQSGRLKLRAFTDGKGELIFYRRSDLAGPKTSFYVLTPTDAVDCLRETLTLAYGQVGRVRKQRRLYLVGRTRVHLDRVEGLGDYMELEVVLAEGEDPAKGEAEAHALMVALGVAPNQLVEGAYVDLLAAKAA